MENSLRSRRSQGKVRENESREKVATLLLHGFDVLILRLHRINSASPRSFENSNDVVPIQEI